MGDCSPNRWRDAAPGSPDVPSPAVAAAQLLKSAAPLPTWSPAVDSTAAAAAAAATAALPPLRRGSEEDATTPAAARRNDQTAASPPLRTPPPSIGFRTAGADAQEGSAAATPATPADPLATPQACVSMIAAVEAAAEAAGDETATPGVALAPNLHAWVRGQAQSTAGPAPTPARAELAALIDAAAERQHLQQQLELLREAELDIAAKEAEETARTFGMLEDEVADLAQANAELQRQLAEAQARAEAARSAAEAAEAEAEAMRRRIEEQKRAALEQQQQQKEQQEQQLKEQQQQQQQQQQGVVPQGEAPQAGASVEEGARQALLRAAEARRQSDAWQAEQVAAFRALEAAEHHLAALEAAAGPPVATGGTSGSGAVTAAAARPRSSAANGPASRPKPAARVSDAGNGSGTPAPGGGPPPRQMQLVEAQAAVAEAAAAAGEASERLKEALAERDALVSELRAAQRRLEAAPIARRDERLLSQLRDARAALRDERAARASVTDALLGHAGRLRRKYRHLEGRYDDLASQYTHMLSAIDALSAQLREAREVVAALQTAGVRALEATPPGAVGRRREAERMMKRLQEAHEAVYELDREKRRLRERLLQAEAFMARLRRRTNAAQRHSGGDDGALVCASAVPSPLLAAVAHPGAAEGSEDAVPATPPSPVAAAAARAGPRAAATPAFPVPPSSATTTPVDRRQGVEGVATAGSDQPPLSPALARARDAPAVAAKWAALREELEQVASGHKGLSSGLARTKSALSVLGRSLGPSPQPRAAAAAAAAAAAPAATATGTGRLSRRQSTTSAPATASAGQGRSGLAAMPGSASRAGPARSSATVAGASVLTGATVRIGRTGSVDAGSARRPRSRNPRSVLASSDRPPSATGAARGVGRAVRGSTEARPQQRPTTADGSSARRAADGPAARRASDGGAAFAQPAQQQAPPPAAVPTAPSPAVVAASPVSALPEPRAPSLDGSPSLASASASTAAVAAAAGGGASVTTAAVTAAAHPLRQQQERGVASVGNGLHGYEESGAASGDEEGGSDGQTSPVRSFAACLAACDAMGPSTALATPVVDGPVVDEATAVAEAAVSSAWPEVSVATAAVPASPSCIPETTVAVPTTAAAASVVSDGVSSGTPGAWPAQDEPSPISFQQPERREPMPPAPLPASSPLPRLSELLSFGGQTTEAPAFMREATPADVSAAPTAVSCMVMGAGAGAGAAAAAAAVPLAAEQGAASVTDARAAPAPHPGPAGVGALRGSVRASADLAAIDWSNVLGVLSGSVVPPAGDPGLMLGGARSGVGSTTGGIGIGGSTSARGAAAGPLSPGAGAGSGATIGAADWGSVLDLLGCPAPSPGCVSAVARPPSTASLPGRPASVARAVATPAAAAAATPAGAEGAASCPGGAPLLSQATPVAASTPGHGAPVMGQDALQAALFGTPGGYSPGGDTPGGPAAATPATAFSAAVWQRYGTAPAGEDAFSGWGADSAAEQSAAPVDEGGPNASAHEMNSDVPGSPAAPCEQMQEEQQQEEEEEEEEEVGAPLEVAAAADGGPLPLLQPIRTAVAAPAAAAADPPSGPGTPFREFRQLRKRAMARAAAAAAQSVSASAAAAAGGGLSPLGAATAAVAGGADASVDEEEGDSACVSRAGSGIPLRPECPTPGSQWSLDSGRASPDAAAAPAGAAAAHGAPPPLSAVAAALAESVTPPRVSRLGAAAAVAAAAASPQDSVPGAGRLDGALTDLESPCGSDDGSCTAPFGWGVPPMVQGALETPATLAAGAAAEDECEGDAKAEATAGGVVAGAAGMTCGGGRLDRAALSLLLTPSAQVQLLFGGEGGATGTTPAPLETAAVDDKECAAGSPQAVAAAAAEAAGPTAAETTEATAQAAATAAASQPLARSLSSLLENYRRQAQQTAAVLSGISAACAATPGAASALRGANALASSYTPSPTTGAAAVAAAAGEGQQVSPARPEPSCAGSISLGGAGGGMALVPTPAAGDAGSWAGLFAAPAGHQPGGSALTTIASPAPTAGIDGASPSPTLFARWRQQRQQHRAAAAAAAVSPSKATAAGVVGPISPVVASAATPVGPGAAALAAGGVQALLDMAESLTPLPATRLPAPAGGEEALGAVLTGGAAAWTPLPAGRLPSADAAAEAAAESPTGGAAAAKRSGSSGGGIAGGIRALLSARRGGDVSALGHRQERSAATGEADGARRVASDSVAIAPAVSGPAVYGASSAGASDQTTPLLLGRGAASDSAIGGVVAAAGAPAAAADAGTQVTPGLRGEDLLVMTPL